MYFTPLISASEKNKMKKDMPGPRAETLMLIRHFARTYEYKPEQRPKDSKYLLNWFYKPTNYTNSHEIKNYWNGKT